MYSYLTDNNTNVKKCKGIKKCVVDEMTHEDYNRCLNEKEIIRKSQKIFQSKLHKVYTEEVNKLLYRLMMIDVLLWMIIFIL